MGERERMSGTFTHSHTSFADNHKMIIKLPHCRSTALDFARILIAMVICTKDRSEVKSGPLHFLLIEALTNLKQNQLIMFVEHCSYAKHVCGPHLISAMFLLSLAS